MTKPSTTPRPRRLIGAVAVLAAAAAVLAACSTGTSGSGSTATPTGGGSSTSSSPITTPSPSPSTSKKVVPVGRPVHIRTLNADNSTYGVGMPIIAYFSKKITDARPLSAATTVTANGKPVVGAWYFEYSSASAAFPIEGHWRPQHFWPAHSRIHVDLPMKGKSGGPGLVFDDSLTLDYSIGAAHMSTVLDSTHTMTVMNDGKLWGTFPVSLGASNTPTLSGTKVIMEKGRDIAMRGPGYYDPHIKFTQRLTYSGEYLHAAPWNCVSQAQGCSSTGVNHIGSIDSSNGCTNLTPTDAAKLYNFLNVGDPVQYPDAMGAKMQIGQGYGDWNVPWSQWLTGGLVRTT
ncbi:MAG: L,D-transpeptidase [Jatrophihabitantaceae bacterium]